MKTTWAPDENVSFFDSLREHNFPRLTLATVIA